MYNPVRGTLVLAAHVSFPHHRIRHFVILSFLVPFEISPLSFTSSSTGLGEDPGLILGVLLIQTFFHFSFILFFIRDE